MKQIFSLMLIIMLGVFLFASDKNNNIHPSELSFAQLEQDTLTVTDEDVELEIAEEQDQDTLVTDENEWEEDREWDEEEHGMTLWDFLSKMSDSYKEEYYNSLKDEKDKEKKSKKKRGYFRFGAGGWDVYTLPLQVDGINNELIRIGLKGFDDNMFLSGGGGWGYVGNSIRLGGLGANGFVVSSGKPEVEGANAKEIKLSLGFGGFTIEKAFHPFNNSEFYIGTMIGGGNAILNIVKWSGPVKWREIWDNGYSFSSDTSFTNFNDYQTKIESDFFTLLPTIGFRYNIFRWCAVGINIGYMYCKVDQDGWEMEGKRVYGVPDIDFSNVIYRFNVYFGG
ncbi:MAG: hypothetical protein DRP89_05785 [Candidatus Neomarinimicrobiota bacterium]|nr:MAG: hypothetical protein DRP89_05785 [Candidatus Neomarinimicrobiota bacterium]